MNNNNKDNNNKEKAGVKRYLLEVGFITENVFMKLFFCALFLRIFFSSASPNGSSRGRRMRTIIKVVTMVTILGGLGFIFGVVWQCIPIQAVWRRVVDDGGRRMEGTRCLNQKMFFYSFGVFDVLMDLIVSWILITIPPSPPISVMTGIYLADYFLSFFLDLYPSDHSSQQSPHHPHQQTRSDSDFHSRRIRHFRFHHSHGILESLLYRGTASHLDEHRIQFLHDSLLSPRPRKSQ